MTTEWIWINGETLPLEECRVGVEDRGFQFADGVYEVIRLYNGAPFTLTEHLQRLGRSASAIEIAPPLSIESLSSEILRLVERSGILDGMVYLQLTRGVAPRNHVIPTDIAPTLLFYVRALPPMGAPGSAEGVKLMTLPDERWKRCWIKAIALLPNLLAKTQAVRQGFDEAVFVDGGILTECAASNLFLVIGGRLITHPVGPKVLPGITRAVLLQCAAELNIPVHQRPIGEHEAQSADEIFITSTTREISWVSQWNAARIADSAGHITLALHRALQDQIATQTGTARERVETLVV